MAKDIDGSASLTINPERNRRIEKYYMDVFIQKKVVQIFIRYRSI